MPRYFFNVFDGRGLLDTDGMELTDAKAAQEFAIHYAGELLQSEADSIKPHTNWRLEVIDEVGCLILCLNFSVTPSPALASHYNRGCGRNVSQ